MGEPFFVYERQDEKGQVPPWVSPFYLVKDKMKRDGSACPLHLVYERQDEKGRVPPPLHLIYERQDEKRRVPPFPSCNMTDQMGRTTKVLEGTFVRPIISERPTIKILERMLDQSAS